MNTVAVSQYGAELILGAFKIKINLHKEYEDLLTTIQELA